MAHKPNSYRKYISSLLALCFLVVVPFDLATFSLGGILYGTYKLAWFFIVPLVLSTLFPGDIPFESYQLVLLESALDLLYHIYKNSDSFVAPFAKQFTQKPSPQECREIMSFGILSTVNPIGSMKTWGKLSCTLCMKERIEIIDNSRRRYSRIINACSEVYGACRHIPGFHRFTQH